MIQARRKLGGDGELRNLNKDVAGPRVLIG
jgi:hypothetical protein